MSAIQHHKRSRFLFYTISGLCLFFLLLYPIGNYFFFEYDQKLFWAFDFTSGIAAICASVSAFIFYWGTGKRFFLGPAIGFGAIGFYDLIYSINIIVRILQDYQWPKDFFETSGYSFLRVFLASLLIWTYSLEREYDTDRRIRFDFSVVASMFIVLMLPMLIYGSCYLTLSFFFIKIQLCNLFSSSIIIIACVVVYKRFKWQRDYFSYIMLISLLFCFWSDIFSIFTYTKNAYYYAIAQGAQLFSSFSVFIGFALQITDEFKISRLELYNRKQAEEKLRSLQFQQTAIYDNLPYMSYLKDFMGSYVLVNKAFEDLCGYPQEFIIGKEDSDLWSNDIASLFVEGDRWVLNNKQQLHREIEIEVMGEVRWFDQYKTPIFDDNFNVTGSTGILVDITSRKEYERQLKKQQAMLSRALMQQELLSEISISFNVIGDFSQIVKYVLDLVGNVISADRMFILEHLSERKWYSWCSSRTRSQSVASFAYADTDVWKDFLMNEPFINSDEIDFMPQDIRQMLQNQNIVAVFGVPIFVNGTYKGCIVSERFDKKRRWNKSEVELLRTTANIYASALERKEIISSLSVSEKATKTILEAIPDSLFRFNKQGVIVFFKMVDGEFGVELNNALNKSVFDVFPRALATKLFEAINVALTQNGVTIEFSYEKLKFLRNYEARFVPISENEVIAIMRNVSQRKEFERKMRIAKLKAEQASKAKSEFLANMSHEIRTPLNAILGFSEILLGKVHDESYKSYLTTILLSGKTLLSLINDILDLSKIEAGKLEIELGPIKIRSVVNEIWQVFRQKAEEKDIEFIKHVDDEVPLELYLDEVRIRQILFNLVGNAMKFTNSGFVRIDVLAERIEDIHYKLVIKVSDSGIGINNSSLEKIFEAFLQQSGQDARKYGGTGLGLAITKKLVEKMNGDITVQSEPDKGSVFTVTIEYVKENIIEGEELIEKESNDVVFAPSKVMIIDDVEFNIFALKGLINDSNLIYLEADSGEAAMEILQDEKPDLIFLDLRMEGMDGYEVNRLIKEELGMEDVPIIAFTASAMKSDMQKLERQFNGILLKPVERARAIEIMKRFLPYTMMESFSGSEQEDTELYKIEDLEKLLNLLEKQLYSEWEEQKSSLVIFEIEAFVNKLKENMEDISVPFFHKYVNELSNAVVSFDVETIERFMSEYENLIAKVKALLAEDREIV